MDDTTTTAATAAPTPSTIARYTSRKLVFCTAVLVVATWLRWRGLIGEASWVSTIATDVTAYVLGNVGQKGVDSLATAIAATIKKVTG